MDSSKAVVLNSEKEEKVSVGFKYDSVMGSIGMVLANPCFFRVRSRLHLHIAWSAASVSRKQLTALGHS